MPDPNAGNSATDTLLEAVKLVFSSLVLMAISVVLGGKLLASNLFLPIGEADEDFFDIRVPLFFRIRATKSQVILGFTAFVITFLIVGFFGGKNLYQAFTEDFGVDPGQWLSLCTLSAFFTVAWTCAVYVISLLLQFGGKKNLGVHDNIIEQLQKGGPGSKIEIPQSPAETTSQGNDNALARPTL